MQEIETRLRAEETEYLQQKIRTNALLDEPAAIAKKILLERGAAIPIAETEDESEEKVQSNMRLSTISAVFVCVYLVLVYFFEPRGVRLIAFTATLVGVLYYLNNQKRS